MLQICACCQLCQLAICQVTLKVHVKRVLKLGIDNMAALACIMKKHTMFPHLAPVLKELLHLQVTESRNISIQAFYVPSALNPADRPSRRLMSLDAA